MPYNAGDRVMLDRSLEVRFVRALDSDRAVIEMAGATQVVPLQALSTDEA
ncbi:MAG: hypothetical protein K0Q52_215 [Microbacterium sp.]|jgi:hypothetical protein|nr:hypothetical protein [Microbacterium sp.]